MNTTPIHDAFKNTDLAGRYITLSDLFPHIENFSSRCTVSVEGHSVLGANLYSLQWGDGPKKVLAWSQMHGNESTTTKAVFDLFNFLEDSGTYKDAVSRFLEQYTLLVLPMLNPDGAAAYTRENANQVDLNRDAKKRTQPESQVLRTVFNRFKPDLCLNLHDQRTIYGVSGGTSATLSFLAPAADRKRSITPARKTAMQLIAAMSEALSVYIPGHIGRYDDTFNENCVGDTFQKKEVPTILFEAGHFPGDYQREQTRKYIFYAFLSLFEIIERPETPYKKYFDIPENQNHYRDMVLRDVSLPEVEGVQSIAIQFKEVLKDDTIRFVPHLDAVGSELELRGHVEKNLKGKKVLINSHENVFVNEEIVTLTDENGDSIEDFLSI